MPRHLISVGDLESSDLLSAFTSFGSPLKTKETESKFWTARKDVAAGKVLISLFFQPSIRTRTSFNAAFFKMGGNAIHFSRIEETLLKKGESIEDTIRFLSQYGDLIVVRSPDDELPGAFAKHSDIPVISAGHGSLEHPTTAINHLHTIFSELGRLEQLCVLIAAKHPKRCINSFIKGLSLFPNNTVAVIDNHRSTIIDTLEAELSGTICFRRFRSIDLALSEIPPKCFDVLIFDEGDEDYKLDPYPAYFFSELEAQRYRAGTVILHFKPILRAFSKGISKALRQSLVDQSRKSGLMRAHIMHLLLQPSNHI